MKSIRTEITIQAPASTVWAILMNFEQYPNWNPFMTIKGEPRLGSRLENAITLAGQPPQVFKPVIIELSPGHSFRWLGHLWVKGLFDGEHYFELEPIGPQQTRLVHGEHFGGLLRGLILRLIAEKTVQGFENMNAALKALAERQFAEGR
ncbi:MAG: SRPBCC domain-containing protein [Saprospiraceae bacterium]|nr:SRPBCC domain-containing protein [Saprospiraceae bacterium]